MEWHKIIYLLDNAINQLSKFRAKNWVEMMMHEEPAAPFFRFHLKLQC